MSVLDPNTVDEAILTPPSPDGRAAAIFGFDTLTPNRPRSSRRRLRLGLVAGAIVVVIVAVLATRALGAGTQSYQAATATTREVESAWNGVATIEPTSQASVAFPVSGTVKTVDVRAGDVVVAGQTLATLDEAALTQTLHQKESALAQAKLTLAKALDGEDVGGTGSPDASSGIVLTAATNTGPDQGSGAPTSGGAGTNPQIAPAQQAVLQAQQQVDAALAASAAALASATQVCATNGSSRPAPAPADGTVTATDTTACESALQKVLAEQQAVSQAQNNLANASRTLDDLLQQQAASSSSSSGTPSGGSGGSSGSGATGSTASSADLAKYQAAVDAAAVEVVAAQQAIGQAKIVSPIAGTVTSVELAVGDDVSSGSSTQVIDVVGKGGYEATTTVSVDDIADIEVGRPATVHPDGVGRRIRGKVVAISVSPVDDDSSTSYRVTVALEGKTDDLRIGSTGSVAIVTERADGAIAVPTSAVSIGANRSTVRVIDGSDVETVEVEVGVVGDTWTQILDGVEDGQRVVVADPDEPLPSSATESSNGNQGGGDFGPPGGGGFPGGGRFLGP